MTNFERIVLRYTARFNDLEKDLVKELAAHGQDLQSQEWKDWMAEIRDRFMNRIEIRSKDFDRIMAGWREFFDAITKPVEAGVAWSLGIWDQKLGDFLTQMDQAYREFKAESKKIIEDAQWKEPHVVHPRREEGNDG